MYRKTVCALLTLMLVLSFGVAPAGAATAEEPEHKLPADLVDGVRGATIGVADIDPNNNTVGGREFAYWMDSTLVPLTGTLTKSGNADLDDYYALYLEAGDVVDITMTDPVGESIDFDLYLYAPSGTMVAYANPRVDTQRLTYTVPTAGDYTLDVYTSSGDGLYTIGGTFNGPSDDIPGTPLPTSPFIKHFDTVSNMDDVYSVYLGEGDVLNLGLYVAGGGFDPTKGNVLLFSPGHDTVFAGPVATSTSGPFVKYLTYTAPVSGTYYIDVYFDDSTVMSVGDLGIVYNIQRAVFRLYNFTNNTHFFTDSASEKDHVLATWPNIFRLDGIAYYVNPANNPLPLYRFYNRNSKSHFYTASLNEANNVIARYSNVFTFDGPTYNVSGAGSPGKTPVYRFFNLRNGSHFYTASAGERDMVQATWPTIYRLEGEAFSIGQ